MSCRLRLAPCVPAAALKGASVSRFRLPRPAAPQSAGLLLAACCGFGVGFGCVAATAQSARGTPGTAAPYSNPFAPDLQTSPDGKTPRFEKFSRKKRTTDNGLPRTFRPIEPLKPLSPPRSGAGTTGFNATNAPVKRTNTTTSAYGTGAYGTKTQGAARIDAAAVTQADTLAPPEDISPYQQPVPPLAGRALAQAPGQPPVPDIGPIRRKPKKRKAHPDEPVDPYAPTGIDAGSFDIYPAIELLGGYNTNPNQVEHGKGAALYTIAPEVQIRSNWARHSLNAELRGSYTGYSPESTPTLNRPYLNGKVDGRLDATRDTHFELGGRVLVSTDNPGSPNLQAGLSKLPIYATFGGSTGVTQAFNRLELKLKGDAERTAYQDSELTDGSTVSNMDRNYNQFGGALRGSYELTPGAKPFVQIGADTRVHDEEPDANGYLRNSKGATGEIGSTFELTHQLTGEVALGYTHRTYDDPRFDAIDGLIGDASLIWTADALNTVKFTASSKVGESAVAGVSGVFYRDVGLQYDHAFRRWLIGSTKFGFGVDTYKGGSTSSTTTTLSICGCVITTPGETTPDRQDLRYSIGLGLTYKFSRELWLKGEFQQNWVRSNVSGNDYDASLFLLGVRLQR